MKKIVAVPDFLGPSGVGAMGEFAVGNPDQCAQIYVGSGSAVDRVIVSPSDGEPFVVAVGNPSPVGPWRGPFTVKGLIKRNATAGYIPPGTAAPLELVFEDRPLLVHPAKRRPLQPQTTSQNSATGGIAQPAAGTYQLAIPFMGRSSLSLTAQPTTGNHAISLDVFGMRTAKPDVREITGVQNFIAGEVVAVEIAGAWDWLLFQFWSADGVFFLDVNYEARD